jgi:hypothetical protein
VGFCHAGNSLSTWCRPAAEGWWSFFRKPAIHGDAPEKRWKSLKWWMRTADESALNQRGAGNP